MDKGFPSREKNSWTNPVPSPGPTLDSLFFYLLVWLDLGQTSAFGALAPHANENLHITLNHPKISNILKLGWASIWIKDRGNLSSPWRSRKFFVPIHVGIWSLADINPHLIYSILERLIITFDIGLVQAISLGLKFQPSQSLCGPYCSWPDSCVQTLFYIYLEKNRPTVWLYYLGHWF